MINNPNPHRYYVTFYDSNYLAKGVSTFLSLKKHYNNFTLYAFCFDDTAYTVTKKLGYKNFIPVHTSEFETEELLKSKEGKTKFYEYYWSCKPHIIKKIMDDKKADIVTYIDCDFMFFDSPEPLFAEMGSADVLIQPNNFSYDEAKQFIPVGYYCSCYESFRNNLNGRRVLDWWHKKCMEWCLAIFEQGKFADQKYLDDWRIRFKNVKEISLIGANVAPWSVQKYDVTLKKNNILINNQKLIYYHYHSFRMNLNDYSYIITGDRENNYRIPADAKRYIYPHYIKLLRDTIKTLRKIPEFQQYALSNPEGTIKLMDPKKDPLFASYKEAPKPKHN